MVICLFSRAVLGAGVIWRQMRWEKGYVARSGEMQGALVGLFEGASVLVVCSLWQGQM